MLFAPTVHKLIRISYNLSLFTPFQVFPTPTWLLHPILLSVWLTARAFIAQVAFLLASSPCSPDPFSISSSLFRLLVYGSVFALLCLHVPLPFSSTRVSRDEDMPFIHFCNHSPAPSCLCPWKNCPPQNQSPAAKKVGDHCHKRNKFTLYSRNKQGNMLFVFAPSCYSRSPNKALPQFPIWLLVNFYWLGKATNPGLWQDELLFLLLFYYLQTRPITGQ